MNGGYAFCEAPNLSNDFWIPTPQSPQRCEVVLRRPAEPSLPRPARLTEVPGYGYQLYQLIQRVFLTNLSWCNLNLSLRPRVEHPRLLHPRQDGPNLYRIWKIEKSRMHFDTSSLIVDNSILLFESFNIYLSQWYANHIWHLWINRLFYVTSFKNSYHYLTVCT